MPLALRADQCLRDVILAAVDLPAHALDVNAVGVFVVRGEVVEAGWVVLQSDGNAGTIFLSAGSSPDGRLVVVTDAGVHLIKPNLILAASHTLWQHSEIKSFERTGVFVQRLRIAKGNREYLDVPSMVDQTDYPVHNAIIHVLLGTRWEPILRSIVEPHGAALARRRAKLVRRDDYGIEDRTKWNKEVDRFCRTVVFPALESAPTLEDLRYFEVSLVMWINAIADNSDGSSVSNPATAH